MDHRYSIFPYNIIFKTILSILFVKTGDLGVQNHDRR